MPAGASYMYGRALEPGPIGHIGCGRGPLPPIWGQDRGREWVQPLSIVGDVLPALSVDQVFDAMAIRLDGPRAAAALAGA